MPRGIFDTRPTLINPCSPFLNGWMFRRIPAAQFWMDACLCKFLLLKPGWMHLWMDVS